MEILEEFEQVKLELREKWLDYYEINREWIELTGLHKGHSWNEIIDGNKITAHCPSLILMIGAISGLDKRIANFIHTSTQLSNYFRIDRYIEILGLRFDPDVALKERAEALAKRQEAELLAAQLQETRLSTPLNHNSDPLLDKLREEINK